MNKNSVFEWQLQNINYKALRQLITTADQRIVERFGTEIEKVNSFFDKKVVELDEILRNLKCDINVEAVRVDELLKAGKSPTSADTSADYMTCFFLRKRIQDLVHEVDLLSQFGSLNAKIREYTMEKSLRVNKIVLEAEASFLNFEEILGEYLVSTNEATEKMEALERHLLGENMEMKDVAYTIGTFDLFHRGHANLLKSMRKFGKRVVVGVHDDESYFLLKKKYAVDNIITRMQAAKKFADEVFVVPATDPTAYLAMMVSDHMVTTGRCCYVRGDDMPDFPSREWVEVCAKGCGCILLRS